MTSVRGIRRAAIAVLAVFATVPAGASLRGSPSDPSEQPHRLPFTLLRDLSITTVRSPHNRCTEDSPADHWRGLRLVLEKVAPDGLPEMTQAVAALSRGDRDRALELLDRASLHDPARLAPPFQEAVSSAKVFAWQLRGCPLALDGTPTLFRE